MSLPKLKLRSRNDWVIDITYPEIGTEKPEAWVFTTKEEAEAKIKRLVEIKVGVVDEPTPPAE